MTKRLIIAVLGFASVAALLAAHGSSIRAQPVASITLPDPGGTISLYPGCNNVGLTFPDGTASGTVAGAVDPPGAVEAMWRHEAAEGRWEGFSPAAAAASDLKTVDFLDAVWLCVRTPSALGLSEEDSGSTAQLRVGDTMDVTLDGNPTTGFTWETEAVDASVLRQLGEPEYVPDPHPVGVVGSGGKFTFRFEAVASGQTLLRLVYHRPWETGVAPEKTFEVTVVVQ